MRLLICDPVSESCEKGLKEIPGIEVITKTGMTPDELIKEIPGYDIAVVRSATKMRANILEASDLKLVIRGGVGLDNIDLVKAKELGITVRNTPTASSASVAELAMAMMFTIARNLYNSTVSMKAGKWEKKRFKGFELGGKTLGIIGIGRIGQELARMANGIGMKVIAFDVKPPASVEDYINMVGNIDELLAQADFISLHVPFIKSVGAIISDDQFSKMKDGVCLVNCSRGGVVDEKALLKALNSGKVKAAGIDVYEKEPTDNTELLENENVLVLSPHVGAQTAEAQNRVGEEIINIVKDFK
ncbi:MAG: 3-phosphoglycerate dehydrogenase [Candidatus Muiribacterium halophilum]|uniref:3-phosphoglycerate dehydrogenase n=1 Tax=Muiribacterium halophilum TaxID=2053465 RepID=A0A2N5ZLW3_MUIH1|nr:MAG: 3-phosphoglycerate dehydrogenase [Candidatus Muirbacterium halophilum]